MQVTLYTIFIVGNPAVIRSFVGLSENFAGTLRRSNISFTSTDPPSVHSAAKCAHIFCTLNSNSSNSTYDWPFSVDLYNMPAYFGLIWWKDRSDWFLILKLASSLRFAKFCLVSLYAHFKNCAFSFPAFVSTKSLNNVKICPTLYNRRPCVAESVGGVRDAVVPTGGLMSGLATLWIVHRTVSRDILASSIFWSLSCKRRFDNPGILRCCIDWVYL